VKIFLSWSKERSKQVALFLHDWLQCVLQSSEPWMSDVDIDRGSLWTNDINGNLNISAAGIICLTKSNLNEPWILFEAGALSKGLESSRVCCLLIDLQPTDISGPLSQFNHTLPDKSNIRKLIFTLNERSDKKLNQEILNKVFEMNWPTFEINLTKIIKETEGDEKSIIPKRSEEEILNEILSTTRMLNKRVNNLEYSQKNREIYNDETKIKDFTKPLKSNKLSNDIIDSKEFFNLFNIVSKTEEEN
jgi:ribosomal protein L18E